MWTSGRRERLQGFARALRPWVDPKSRRPLVLLFVVSLAIFLAPLGFEVAVALIYRLPRWFRWGFGEAAFLAILALAIRRLWRVAPSDTWPGRDEPGVDMPGARWVPWAMRLAVASLIVPILRHADGGVGFADWDFVLDKFEAVRRTILEWGQFPWWHPWCRGGFPLAAEPQIGAVSMATPLILAFGCTIGLGISAGLCLLIAVEGAYRLAWLWFREPWSSAAAALIYGLNGAVILNTAWGYVLPMSYCSLPWMALYAFRIGDRFADGLALGFWTAFAVMNGIQYTTLYAGLLAGTIWLRAARVLPTSERPRLFRNTAAAVGLFLAVCGIRLATVLLVLLDDRRGGANNWDESPLAVIHHLLDRPPPDWPTSVPVQHVAAFVETTSYVGPLVLLLALISLVKGWRWWHALTLVAALFALGSMRWYHPSYWTSSWPFFASTHIVTRWRFVTLLGLGLSAGSVLAQWRHSRARVARAATSLLAVAISVDLLTLAYRQLPLAFRAPGASDLAPGPPVPDIVNVLDGVGYPCVMRGYGVIQGYEPMVGGYHRNAPTLRLARDNPSYRGEAWTEEGEVRSVSWSPNRIIFRVSPGQEVFINQNPGSWWWVNGRPAFAGLRCAEPLVPFAIRADGSGRIDLQIRPRGLGGGIALHGAGVLLLAVASWAGRRPSPEGSRRG